MLSEVILFSLAALVLYGLNVMYKPIERIGNRFRSDRIICRKPIVQKIWGCLGLFLLIAFGRGIFSKPDLFGVLLFCTLFLLFLYLAGPDDIIIYPQTMTYVRVESLFRLFRVTRGSTDEFSCIYTYIRPYNRRMAPFEVRACWLDTNHAITLLDCYDLERAKSFSQDMSQILNVPNEGVIDANILVVNRHTK